MTGAVDVALVTISGIGIEESIERPPAVLHANPSGEANGRRAAPALEAPSLRVAISIDEVDAGNKGALHSGPLRARGREVYRLCTCQPGPVDLSMAKLFATEAANRAAYQGAPMHGGHGCRGLHVEPLFDGAAHRLLS